MKKLFLFAATLLGLVACNKNEADINVPARQITIHATADMNNGSAASGPHRIAPNDITASSVSFYWQEGDKVWVLSGDFSEKQIFTIDNSSINGNQANFTGTALSDMSSYHVIYLDNMVSEETLMAIISGEDPVTFNYNPDSKNWFFIGQGQKDNFTLGCSTIRMQLKGSCKLSKVTFIWMDDKKLEGYDPATRTINFVHGSYDGLQLTSTPVEVVMPLPNKTIYGFTLRFYDTDDNLIMEKSKKGRGLYDDLDNYGLVNLGVLEVKADPYNGHAYVDLGLPSGLIWATMNVGATKPEEYGDYFAWGETEPYYTGLNADGSATGWKTDKETYKWQSYCGNSDFVEWNPAPYDDNKILLLTKDAAHVNWGGNWRMPTADEFNELLSNCDQSWTTEGGVEGYKFASKTNSDNYIFLPAAGHFGNLNTSPIDVSYGSYWSSSLLTFTSSCGRFLKFNSRDGAFTLLDNFLYGRYRYCGLPVRPVCQ